MNFINQTFINIRSKTIDSNIPNSSHHQLISKLFQQINTYYEQDDKPSQPRPKIQSRQTKIIPFNYSQRNIYDPTDNLIDRLYPTIQQDSKFVFIKTREKAIQQPFSSRRRIKMNEEPKFQLNPIKKTNKIQYITKQIVPSKKIIQQKTDNSFYIVNSINMLKTMKKDKIKLFNCSFN